MGADHVTRRFNAFSAGLKSSWLHLRWDTAWPDLEMIRKKMTAIRIRAVIAALVVSTARANLIDLTPGGFNAANGLPPAFQRLQTQLFFDEAAFGTFNLPTGPKFFDGWVSQFGVLNGGQYFFTNLFSVSPTASASISWNFNGAPNGDWLSTIDVFTQTPTGTVNENIYGVPWGQRFDGTGTVTIDGTSQINGISFYGLNPATVTDGGMTLTLFSLSLLAFGYLQYKTQRRKSA